MTRRVTAPLALALVAAVVLLDLRAAPPNPWVAPPMLALGSGVTASGGFCGALPN
ncbi:hypothetical protein [Falsirhodobacter halotolerans]|uniref:hypothetical protein n=1 Tax=Falsirhodobacter halotolerans TaxID=1146892 RepID=UPI001FD06063|nr:hypothetical protein [Falsirhodobacter halotolerans]MCJ8139005.1 hypothetical protein [Falsirhodobacter halotolerans]